MFRRMSSNTPALSCTTTAAPGDPVSIVVPTPKPATHDAPKFSKEPSDDAEAETKMAAYQPKVSRLIREIEELKRQTEEAKRQTEEAKRQTEEAKRQTEESERQIKELNRRNEEFNRRTEEFNRQNEETKRQIEELKRQNEETKRQIEELKRQTKEAEHQIGRSLVQRGFPKAPTSDPRSDRLLRNIFDFSPCKGFQYDLQRPQDCIFRALQTLPARKFAKGRAGWIADGIVEANRGSLKNLTWGTLAEIAEIYQQELPVQDHPLADSTPDICVLSNGQDPLAAIHVEMDSDNEWSYRLMSKYLTNLRLDGGVSAPIGIISSYHEWQFCWHKYASPVAEATTIEEVQRFCAPEPVDADFDSLCVSPVYSYDNPCLLQLLASFLVKAAHIPSCAPVTDPWLMYTRKEQRIRLGRLDLAKVRHYDMVPESANELFRVKLMGRDSEGLVLKMATKDGECCAAKFCSRSPLKRAKDGIWGCMQTDSGLCQEELDRWVEAYGKDCGVRMTYLAGRPVILMPFYEPLSEADWEAPGTMDMVLDHFKELATRDDDEEERNGTGKRKVFHRNIKRCHIMWGDKDHTCVRLIDWGRAYKDASLPETSDEVREILQSDSSPEVKKKKVALHVRRYLQAARTILQSPVPTRIIERAARVIKAPQAEDDYGEKFKIEFKDPFAELYDRDRDAFNAEMRKPSKDGGRQKWE